MPPRQLTAATTMDDHDREIDATRTHPFDHARAAIAVNFEL